MHLSTISGILIFGLILLNGRTKASECHRTNTWLDRRRPDYKKPEGIGSYKIYTEAKNWTEAREACIQDEAHLVIINSKLEEEILAEMLENARDEIKRNVRYNSQAWIGTYKPEDDWITVCNEPAYTHWGKAKNGLKMPLHARGFECGGLYHEKGNGMGSFNCSQKYAFICEL